MLLKIGMAFMAFCAGSIVSMGVFSVLIAVSLIPRFAGKTDTAKHIFLYEDLVVIGIILGIVLSVFTPYIKPSEWFSDYAVWEWIAKLLLILYGLFTGVFVGCLAVAIAEMLDAIPIFARRISFEKGIGIAVIAVAVGKLLGAFLYYNNGLFVSVG